MFDHVAIAVSDLAASERFYRTVLSVLGIEPSHADAELVEWEDWDIGPTDREHPVTRGLHVGFRAPSRAAVDAFWQAGIDAGYRDDGAPGPRTEYGPDYYGGFLLDPQHGEDDAIEPLGRGQVRDGDADVVEHLAEAIDGRDQVAMTSRLGWGLEHMSTDTFCSRRPSCAPARKRRVVDLGGPSAAHRCDGLKPC